MCAGQLSEFLLAENADSPVISPNFWHQGLYPQYTKEELFSSIWGQEKKKEHKIMTLKVSPPNWSNLHLPTLGLTVNNCQPTPSEPLVTSDDKGTKTKRYLGKSIMKETK